MKKHNYEFNGFMITIRGSGFENALYPSLNSIQDLRRVSNEFGIAAQGSKYLM